MDTDPVINQIVDIMSTALALERVIDSVLFRLFWGEESKLCGSLGTLAGSFAVCLQSVSVHGNRAIIISVKVSFKSALRGLLGFTQDTGSEI